MTDYYIFRHGDTIETDSPLIRFFGHKSDSRYIDIEPRATNALERIGKYLKNIPTDINFTSPYPRCVNSALIVSKITNSVFKLDDRLTEIEKNGEKISDFEKRVRSFVEEVDAKKYSSVAICTHGAVIGALKHLVTKNSFNFFNTWDYPQPGNLIIIKEGHITRIDFNS